MSIYIHSYVKRTFRGSYSDTIRFHLTGAKYPCDMIALHPARMGYGIYREPHPDLLGLLCNSVFSHAPCYAFASSYSFRSTISDVFFSMTVLFFTLSGLDLMNALDEVDDVERKHIIDWIYSLQILPEDKGKTW